MTVVTDICTETKQPSTHNAGKPPKSCCTCLAYITDRKAYTLALHGKYNNNPKSNTIGSFKETGFLWKICPSNRVEYEYES